MSVDLSTAGARSRTQRKCDAILTAGAKAFLTVGFERANMDDIAAEADVSKRTIYAHYESKEGLFEAVVAIMASRIDKTPDVPWNPSRDVEEQIRDIARVKLALFEDRNFSGLLRMVIGVFAAQPELARRAVNAVNQCDNGIEAWITAAQRDGMLTHIDAREADEMFGSLVMSMLVWPILSNRPLDASGRRTRMDAIAGMFAGYLRGD